MNTLGRTCHSKKSLNRTSPDVRTTISGSIELCEYKHSWNSSSVMSLENILVSMSWNIYLFISIYYTLSINGAKETKNLNLINFNWRLMWTQIWYIYYSNNITLIITQVDPHLNPKMENSTNFNDLLDIDFILVHALDQSVDCVRNFFGRSVRHAHVQRGTLVLIWLVLYFAHHLLQLWRKARNVSEHLDASMFAQDLAA